MTWRHETTRKHVFSVQDSFVFVMISILFRLSTHDSSVSRVPLDPSKSLWLSDISLKTITSSVIFLSCSFLHVLVTSSVRGGGGGN